MEENKRKKDADIHIRCYKEDKQYVEQRSKDGFGNEHNSKTNFVLYALRHVDDASPVNLYEADALIKAIGDNRQTLYGIHVGLGDIVQEMNAMGNNINQIARQINTAMKMARAEGESGKSIMGRLQNFENEVNYALYQLEEKIAEWDNHLTPMKKAVSTTLKGENEILSRCLVFPKVGTTKRREAQLLRLIQDFRREHPEYEYKYMLLAGFIHKVEDVIKAADEGRKED